MGAGAVKPSGPRAPVGLQARGRRMWTQSLATWSLTPAHLVLLEEACRVADRCELLDRLIRAALKRPAKEDGGDRPDIPSLMAEARAQQTTLKGLLLELRQGQRLAGAAPERTTAAEGSEDSGGTDVADLSARIAARRGRPQG